jgi:hypothetical protein
MRDTHPDVVGRARARELQDPALENAGGGVFCIYCNESLSNRSREFRASHALNCAINQAKKRKARAELEDAHEFEAVDPEFEEDAEEENLGDVDLDLEFEEDADDGLYENLGGGEGVEGHSSPNTAIVVPAQGERRPRDWHEVQDWSAGCVYKSPPQAVAKVNFMLSNLLLASGEKFSDKQHEKVLKLLNNPEFRQAYMDRKMVSHAKFKELEKESLAKFYEVKLDDRSVMYAKSWDDVVKSLVQDSESFRQYEWGNKEAPDPDSLSSRCFDFSGPRKILEEVWADPGLGEKTRVILLELWVDTGEVQDFKRAPSYLMILATPMNPPSSVQRQPGVSVLVAFADGSVSPNLAFKAFEDDLANLAKTPRLLDDTDHCYVVRVGRVMGDLPGVCFDFYFFPLTVEIKRYDLLLVS